MMNSKIRGYIDLLEQQIPMFQTINDKVSNGSVGWHMEHSLLVLNGVIFQLSKSNPTNYQWKFNPLRAVIFTLKKIPRGKAKSPESVYPSDNLSIESLEKHISISKQKLAELEKMGDGQFFEHPKFGHLQLKDTIKFLEIHTNHHLAIINDILK